MSFWFGLAMCVVGNQKTDEITKNSLPKVIWIVYQMVKSQNARNFVKLLKSQDFVAATLESQRWSLQILLAWQTSKNLTSNLFSFGIYCSDNLSWQLHKKNADDFFLSKKKLQVTTFVLSGVRLISQNTFGKSKLYCAVIWNGISSSRKWREMLANMFLW